MDTSTSISTDNKYGINISTATELSSLNTNYNIIIINDINITNNFVSIILTGKIINIDGGGNTINIDINNKIWNGLFKVNSANKIITIKNLHLNFIGTENPYNISNNNGGILGDCSSYNSNNQIKINNCSVTGNIIISGTNSGGIIGMNSVCTIINCCTTCNITGKNSGGICGAHSNSAIRSSFSSGNIIGKGSGGIVGSNSICNISNCKSTGNIDNGSGGIVGDKCAKGKISNCYSLGNIDNNSGGIIAGNNNLISITS
jgi:hypothetical protein